MQYKFLFLLFFFPSFFSVNAQGDHSGGGRSTVSSFNSDISSRRILGRKRVETSSVLFGSKKIKLSNPVFKINIDRKVSSENCTQGYIAVNDSVIGYTLELPDLSNKKYISSIPKGTYSANIRTDGSKGWRIELQDVPGRPNIQIHVGNYTSDIKGCILIGTKVDIENCSVLNNFKREAIDKLQKMFNSFTTDLILNQGSTNPIDITVEISGI